MVDTYRQHTSLKSNHYNYNFFCYIYTNDKTTKDIYYETTRFLRNQRVDIRMIGEIWVHNEGFSTEGPGDFHPRRTGLTKDTHKDKDVNSTIKHNYDERETRTKKGGLSLEEFPVFTSDIKNMRGTDLIFYTTHKDLIYLFTFITDKTIYF